MQVRRFVTFGAPVLNFWFMQAPKKGNYTVFSNLLSVSNILLSVSVSGAIGQVQQFIYMDKNHVGLMSMSTLDVISWVIL